MNQMAYLPDANQKPAISVVIPIFNEETSVATIIKTVEAELAQAAGPFEIIAINDGSTDNTSEVLHKIKADYPKLTIIEHRHNFGYGAAIKTGISRSAFDWIMIIDADCTYDATELPQLLKACGFYDMVVGSRTGHKVHISLIRRPAKLILTRLAEFLTNHDIPDLNSGFRIFKKEIFGRFQRMFPDGFSFTSTLTLIALDQKYNIKYIPIKYLRREGQSKIRPIRDTLTFLQLVCRIVLYFNPMKVFFPMSLIFFGISVFLYIDRFISGKGFLVTCIITFVCGVQLLAIGLLADLIDKRLR